MRKSIILLSLLTAAPLMAQSSPGLPGAPEPERVTTGTYSVDPNHTLVGWRVNHFGFNDYFGIFGDATGTLTLDPANPDAAKVEITIPIANVTVASSGLKDHLLRPGKDGGKPDFFGPEPGEAKFVSTSVATDGASATIMGNLTMNGVTRPLTLQADFVGAGTNPFNKKETIGFEATGSIDRSEFGIAYGIPVVSDEVELNITAAFEKQ